LEQQGVTVDENMTVKELWLAKVIQEGGDSFQYASNSLKADKEFVIEIVKTPGRSFSYVADHLKADKEVVLAAFTHCSCCGDSLRYAADNLKAVGDCHAEWLFIAICGRPSES